jgi:hypothetical protein
MEHRYFLDKFRKKCYFVALYLNQQPLSIRDGTTKNTAFTNVATVLFFFATLAITNVLNFKTLVMGPKKKIINTNFTNVPN